jgi:N-acyl-D-aspartate/D-glutamate deacylase
LLILFGCQQDPTPFLSAYPKIDLLIENGAVLDGLGNEAVVADVVVVGDTIVFVGDAGFSAEDIETRVAKRIDAAGKTVAPGFIDLHSHGNPLETPHFENFLAMGVTTISLGEDGDSPYVVPLSDWLTEVSNKGIGTNLAMFVGHGTLRDQSGIGMSGSPEPEATARMLAMLDETLKYTFGMSTGLEYNPGLNATTDELRELARVVGRNERMIMSHMRNEDDDQLEASIAELLEQGEDARVHISHLKAVYGNGTARAEEILGILADARAAGVDITADIYPYSASYTGIDIVFPV